MSWQSRIYHKYRLDEQGLKILSDFTGLLVHPAFIKFLADEKKPVIIARNITEILNNQRDQNLIILCLKYQIPSFISLKTEVIYFDFSDIPVNGHPGLFKDISPDSLVPVLDYLDEKQPHLFVAESELSELLINAEEFNDIKFLNSLRDGIQSGLNLPINADNLLALAEVWAAIQYTSYKLKETAYLALKSPLDEHCNPYFTEGKWQEAFYAPVSNPKTVNKIIHRIKQEKAWYKTETLSEIAQQLHPSAWEYIIRNNEHIIMLR
jgi:hypothetical protein